MYQRQGLAQGYFKWYWYWYWYRYCKASVEDKAEELEIRLQTPENSTKAPGNEGNTFKIHTIMDGL